MFHYLRVMLITLMASCWCANIEAKLPEDVQLHNFAIGGTFYEWETKPDLEAFNRVSVEAFYQCYREIPLSAFGFDDSADLKEEILKMQRDIDEVAIGLQEPGSQLRLLTAKRDEAPVGYVMFDMTLYPEQVYISELAVDPTFQRQGIGTQLVFSILEQLSDIKKLVLITRKVNFQACAFYPAIEFESSDYMHEGYNPELFTGFEYINDYPLELLKVQQ